MENKPKAISLVSMFEDQVQRSPDATALWFENETLTYRELNEKSNRLACHLKVLMMVPEEPVVICMERSLEMVIAIYAIIKAGGAYVPMEPDNPQSRINYMVENVHARLMLTQERFVDTLKNCCNHLIPVDSLWDTIAKESSENPGEPIGGRNLAYIIHTSGSTGKPKGVMCEHEGIVNRINFMQKELVLSERDRIVQKTPYTFDVSVWEFFWPLQIGATLVIARPKGHMDNAYLIDLINSQNVTLIHFVPSMLKLFLEDKAAASCRGLKHVICSGEALRVDHVTNFFSLFSAKLYNMYGPTESGEVTNYVCDTDAELSSIPIGRPFDSAYFRVLDESLDEVPAGEVGELYIGGNAVARGYVNQPGLTAERFIPDPYHDNPGRIIYKTGDLCRWLPDGNLEYLGRTDFQVKIRGQRVELGEIEACLLALEGVIEAVVLVREDEPDRQTLVAYMLGAEAVSPVVLRRELRNELPQYMVPDLFVQLDAFPRTTSGKIDRNALPAPVRPKPDRDASYVKPATQREKAVADMLASILGVEAVGVMDSFFDLGANSLQLIVLHGKLEDAMGQKVNQVELFAYPTIRSLAAFLDTLQKVEITEKGVDAVSRAAQRRLMKNRRANRG